MINTLVGFSAKQMGAIRAVVLEHGSGIVTRKAMEEKCRARVDGTRCEYPPATIFKNEAMKLRIKIGDVEHVVKNTFRIPWKLLGMFKTPEDKATREMLETNDKARLAAATDAIKSKLKSQKVTPQVTPVATSPVTPEGPKGKGKTPKVTGSAPKAKKTKAVSAAASTGTVETPDMPVADTAVGPNDVIAE